MTGINSISSSSNIYQTSQVSSGTTAARFKPDDESHHDKDGGGLLGAIDSALKAAGISGGLSSILKETDSTSTSSTSNTGSTTDTASTTDASSALSEFMANLMAALQSQNGKNVDASSETSDMPPPPPPPMGMGKGDIEDKLQSLITQLNNASITTSSDSTDTGSDALSTSFSDLMSALGKQSSTSSDLEAFLQALSSKLSGQGSAGNVIDTKA